ncbi:STAS domain-containing protein [Dactylosporangium sucinum]|uniref:STAS domain-containing protein n=1 Tax=Dactylosporangium sucinum TaxID=1424081 RepID=A0A917TNZ2_9ACTN|nr:STAS domain-containing protein [Dactylosporangium sucinum]GGM30138.1 hypothetical protein GCM10007977_034260 [Dactylosporangium sucinum]
MDFSLDGRGAAETVGVTIVADDDPAVVRVAGRLVFDTLGPLTVAIDALRAASATRLVLDLSGVPICDSSALSLFTRTHRDLTAAGGWLRLAGTRPLVDKVLEVTDLDRLLPRYDAVEAALAP